MSVEFKDGIGFSRNTSAAFMAPTGSDADGKSSISTPKEYKSDSLVYAPWGINNDLPIKMAEDIGQCGVLSAGLDMKVRIAMGKGLMPFLLMNVDKEGKEELEWVSDSEINDWFDLNDSYGMGQLSMYDKLSYGFPTWSMILSRNRKKINRIKRIDSYSVRLEKMDANGYINNIYVGSDWQNKSDVKSEYVVKIPMLEENNEYFELLDRTSGYEFAMVVRHLRNGKLYYPDVLWYSAKAWVDQTKSIPRLKNALMKNQVTVKYLITISEQYWRRIHKLWDTYKPEAREKIIKDKLDEIDKYLSGIDNQYKSLTAMKYVDPVTKVEVADISITVIDDKISDGKFLPDSQAGNSEILFALQINPAMVGAGQPGGAYANNAGGSNIRESYLTEVMKSEWERKDNAKIFNVVKNYNGWTRLEKETTVFPVTAPGAPVPTEGRKIKPRLVFRYPSGVLTTLDTGKSTKGEVL